MIRVVTVTALLALLVLVLYLPALHAPERLLALMRSEQQAAAAYWGHAAASRVLVRAIATQVEARDAAQAAQLVPSNPAPPHSIDTLAARELAAASQRMYSSSYFRSIEALTVLAALRLSWLVEWLAWLCVFAVALIVDGLMTRHIKAREFGQHDPEMFAVYACGAIMTVCAAVVALVWPTPLHPALMPCAPLVVFAFIGRSIGHFHRRA
jgi:hypothetical protein